MRIKNLSTFLKNDSGAVALDWVALTSTVVVIGMGLAYMIFGGEEGPLTIMIANYNAELSDAASNLTGVVAEQTPGILE